MGGGVEMTLKLTCRRRGEDTAVVAVDLPVEARDGRVEALEDGSRRQDLDDVGLDHRRRGGGRMRRLWPWVPP